MSDDVIHVAAAHLRPWAGVVDFAGLRVARDGAVEFTQDLVLPWEADLEYVQARGFARFGALDAICPDGAEAAQVGAVIARPAISDLEEADLRLGGRGDTGVALLAHVVLPTGGTLLHLGGQAQICRVDCAVTDPVAPGAVSAQYAGDALCLIDGRADGSLDEDVAAAHLAGAALPEQASAQTARAAVAARIAQTLGDVDRLWVSHDGPDPDPDLCQMIAALTGADLHLVGGCFTARARAHRAARAWFGQSTSCPGSSGVAAPVGGATIWRP